MTFEQETEAIDNPTELIRWFDITGDGLEPIDFELTEPIPHIPWVENAHRLQLEGSDFPKFAYARVGIGKRPDFHKLSAFPKDINAILAKDRTGNLLGSNTPKKVLTWIKSKLLDACFEGLDEDNLEPLDENTVSRVIDSKAWFELREIDNSMLCEKSGWTVYCTNCEPDKNPMLLEFKCVPLNAVKSLFVYRHEKHNYDSEEFTDQVDEIFSKSTFLSEEYIVQRLATFNKTLFNRLLTYLEDKAICYAYRTAVKHLADNLHGYSYQFHNSEPKRKIADLSKPEFLLNLAGAISRNIDYLISLDDLNENELDRIKRLLKLSKDSDYAINDFVIDIAENRKIPSETSGEVDYIACFDYSVNKVIACLALKQIPNASNVSYPQLDVQSIVPVFLPKLDQSDGKRLDQTHPRVSILKGVLTIFTIPLRSPNRDASVVYKLMNKFSYLQKEDLEGVLKSIIHKRLPMHERRILMQMGFPPRETFNDIKDHRIYSGSDLSRLSTAIDENSHDDALIQVIFDVLKFRGDLSYATSQEEVRKVLELNAFGENEKFPSDAIVPTVEVLKRLIDFSQLEDKDIIDWLDQRRRIFKRKRYFLLESLTEWTMTLLTKGKKSLQEKDIPKELRYGLWLELKMIFPDDNDWYYLDEKQTSNISSPGNKLTVFANTVLSCALHRPNLIRFANPLQLPARELNVAYHSITRLNNLAAIFPICCGDWAGSDYFKIVYKFTKIEASRIFASARPIRSYENKEWKHSDPLLASNASICFGSRCNHCISNESKDKSLIWKINNLINDEESESIKSLYLSLSRIGFWLNSLIDYDAHNHFRCSSCNKLMTPSIKSKNPYIFDCPLTPTKVNHDHDKGVYVNWCLGSGCHKVIDSREDTNLCSNGKHICSSCSSCCTDHHLHAGEDANPACRNCRRELPIPTNVQFEESGVNKITCICGTLNRISKYGNSGKRESDSAIYPSEYRGLFFYNTRPIDTGR